MHIDASKIQTGTYEPKLESFDKNTSHKLTLWTDTIQITVIQKLDCNLGQGDLEPFIDKIEGPLKL